MEHSPSREANSHSGSKDISRRMEHEGSLQCSQDPATGPYPEPDESLHYIRCVKAEVNITQFLQLCSSRQSGKLFHLGDDFIESDFS
jgi:hypothetical protein